jgi:hypothetical protein
MNFDLHKPCSGCPFLKEGGVKFLGKPRAREIANYMASSQGASFPCHKTVDYSDDEDSDFHAPGPKEQHCAGALLFMEKVNPGGNQMARIAERLGLYDRTQFKGAELVFNSVREMINAHSRLG